MSKRTVAGMLTISGLFWIVEALFSRNSMGCIAAVFAFVASGGCYLNELIKEEMRRRM